MRGFVFIASVLIAGVAGLARGPVLAAPAPRAKPESFLPTAVGTSWVTGDPSDTDRERDRTHTVTAVERTPDGLVVTVSWRWQHDLGKVFLVPGEKAVPDVRVHEGADRYRVGSGGVYRVARRDGRDGEWVPLDPPWCAMKSPATPGAEWVFASPDGGHRVTSTVVGPERVTVPAGTFDAVRVRSRAVQKGRPVVVLSAWEVPGIGTVKVQYDDPPDPRGLVLQSFTPAKK